MQAIQKNIQEFCQLNNISCPVEARVLDLVSEVGEVAKEVLKSTDYGKHGLALNKGLEMETGDVLFSLICLCNDLNIDLGTALSKALAKYQQRLRDKGNISS